MSYDDYATSEDRGQPVELYLFTYGVDPDTDEPLQYAYTDAEKSVEYDGVTYAPLAITRSNIKTKGGIDTAEVTIDVPRSAEIAELFRIFPPPYVVTVKVTQGNLANADDDASWLLGELFPVAWVGRVLACTREEGLGATLACEAASANMKRPGLRRHYQWPCPLALYGTRCKASEAASTTTTTVSSVSGNEVTLLSGWNGTHDTSHYVGGMVRWGGSMGREVQTILSVQGDTLHLAGPARALSAADAIDVVLGCARTLAACRDVHNNVVNYGGQPFIPTHNPIGKNNHY